MEGLDQDDVIQILRMLDESNFDELRLEMGGVKLEVSKSGKRVKPKEGHEINNPESGPSKATAEAVPEKVAETPKACAPEEQGAENLVAIKAPMLGTFYSAPKPGAPPFVEEGQMVGEDDSLCIIEVMKLFNTVKAGAEGTIVKICAENGEMVEYQQTLFLVKPSADDPKTDGESAS